MRGWHSHFPIVIFLGLVAFGFAGDDAPKKPKSDDGAAKVSTTGTDEAPVKSRLTGRLKFRKESDVDDATPSEIEQLKLRAESGDAIAQYRFGLRLAKGLGVPQDEVEACKWLELSGDTSYLNSVRTRLTREEVTDAKRRASAWLAGFGKRGG